MLFSILREAMPMINDVLSVLTIIAFCVTKLICVVSPRLLGVHAARC